MSFLKKLQGIAKQDYNSYLEKAQANGQKIIGYFCSYIPEEIFHAAGFIPYRIRAVGSQGTSKGDIYFSSLNCTFVRHTFDKMLRGKFDFLDGIVFMNGCDHTRRLYDNWRYSEIAPDKYKYMFFAPHVISPSSEEKMADEIKLLIESLEKNFKVQISPATLKKSISLYNQKRDLLTKLYDLRKNKDIPLKGSEVLAIMLAVVILPVEITINFLQDILEEVKGRKVNKDNDLRIFLTSGCCEEVEHLELIEESGSIIVNDNICLGAKNFDTLVDESLDPIVALAQRYINHLSCPRMMNDVKGRLDNLYKIKEDYKIEAIIAEKLKFCDLWGGELFIYRQEAKKNKFPLLVLERELYGGATGQLKTRIQAFFEKVKNNQTIGDNFIRTSGDNYQFSSK